MVYRNKLKQPLRLSLFFAFLFFASHIKVCAQAKNLDSLLQEFKYSEGVDLRTYDQIFIAVYPEYLSELIVVAEDLLARSVSKGNADGMHRAADAFGLYFMSKGYFNQAFKLLYRSMRYYEKTENPSYLIKGYHYLGTLYFKWGKYSEAIYWFEKCKFLAEQSPERFQLHTALINLSNSFIHFGDEQQALAYLNISKSELAYMNDETQANFHTLYGNICMNRNQVDSAQYYYKKSLEISLKSTQNSSISIAYMNLGILAFQSDVNLSKIYFDSSLYFANNSGIMERISLSYFNLSSWYYGTDSVELAIRCLNKSYEYAKAVNSYSDMTDVLVELSSIYQEKNDWQRSDSIQQIIRGIDGRIYNEFSSAQIDMEKLDDLFINEQNKNMRLSYKTDRFLNIRAKELAILILLIALVMQFILILWLWKRSKM